MKENGGEGALQQAALDVAELMEESGIPPPPPLPKPPPPLPTGNDAWDTALYGRPKATPKDERETWTDLAISTVQHQATSGPSSEGTLVDMDEIQEPVAKGRIALGDME